MSVKRLLMAALVAVMMLAASAFAQKNELTGIIGRTFISDQGVQGVSLANNNLHFGNGLTFEVNYGAFLDGKYVCPSYVRGARGLRHRSRPPV